MLQQPLARQLLQTCCLLLAALTLQQPLTSRSFLSQTYPEKHQDKKLFQSQQTDGSAAFTLASVRGDTILTELVREQRLSLDGVPALTDLPTAVAQVEANLPGNAAAAICISDLQQRAIANRLLVLQRFSTKLFKLF